MRKLSLIFGIILLVSMFLPQSSINADTKYASAIGIKQVVDNNVDVTYTGKHWADVKGNTQYEYVARINQAPIYNDDGSLVDCAWHYVEPQPIYNDDAERKGETIVGYTDASYSILNNVFTATVVGSAISTTYQGQTMSWNPVVMVGTKEYVAKGIPTVIAVDPTNSNYRNNILEWDYGVCKRRVRVIEGLIQETWIFDKNPKGTVWIKDNSQKTYGYKWAIAPYAYDALDNQLVINQYKQVTEYEFNRAVYPVTIDPTEVYYTSASDGYISSADSVYNTAWIAAFGTVWDTGATLTSGQGVSAGTYYLYKAFFFFDTSALPDGCIVSAANISLYVSSDGSTTDFNLSAQSGQPTYPHNPLVQADFDKSFYSGIGASKNTSTFGAGYNNISMNSTGLAWVSKTGETKLCLRSTQDIIGVAPTDYSYVQFYTYEKGAGYRPYIEVTYASSGVPTVTTNPATYVTKTTAQLNGYISSDGGETDTALFNYQHWYNQNWSDCIEFTINSSLVDADLTNFPVLVTGAQLNTTDPDFWSSTRANGSDIIFTASDGVTKLNRELVSFCTSTFAMECYVNVSTVYNLTDTKFYMYYNNSAGLETNSTATWDTNYIAVFHMNDNPNTSAIQDSTVYNKDGTKKGANEPLAITGIFNGDIAQQFDATDDYINASIALNGSLTDITLESVAKTFNASGTGAIISADSYFARQIASPSYYGRGDNAGAMTTGTKAFVNGSYFYGATWYDQDGTNSDLNARVNMSIGAAVHYTKMVLPYYGGFIGKITTAGTAFWNGSITEVRVSNSSRSIAWMNASYYSLIFPTDFARVTDVFTSTANQSKVTGDSFLASVSGLTGNALYGFKSEAINSYGTAWGHWLFINTSVTLGSPANVSCNPSYNAINLSWVKGGNSSYTYIRYKIGSYPSGVTDGNAVANQSGVNFTHSGLASGTSYYYRLWGEDGGLLSTTNTTIMCTTTASSPYSTIVPLPTLNTSGYDDTPNGSALVNNPLYPLGNLEAAAISVPQSTWWMLVGLGGLIVTGLFIYTRSRNLLAALAAMIIFGVIMSQMGIFPIWVMYVFGLSGIGMSWKELR